MGLKKDVNFEQFLRSVNECESDVLFCTKEGDVLNLKSMLSRFVFASLTMDAEILDTATIVCENKEDESILAQYLQD